MAHRRKILRHRCLQIQQNDGNPLYLLGMTGDELLQIADISRVSRDDAGKLLGYQRPEVKRHVGDIVEYLNSEQVLFPNSLIIALSSNVNFKKTRGPQIGDGRTCTGTLEIPISSDPKQKPAWIVDGQQRALAISKSKRKDLPIPVNAFVADDVGLQRDQFLRINNSKPLPRGLISELLPEVATPLPANLAARRIPSALCNLLNQDEDSPFYGLIKRASTAQADRKHAVVTDTSVMKFLEESLKSPSGCLFPYRNLATGETDFEGILQVLYAYWGAVRDVFPEAWGKPPNKSRLMHGVGIRSMGRLMDRVMSQVEVNSPKARKLATAELAHIAGDCAWTRGRWPDLGGVGWNELQNVPKHIRLLSNHLVRLYLHSKGRVG